MYECLSLTLSDQLHPVVLLSISVGYDVQCEVTVRHLEGRLVECSVQHLLNHLHIGQVDVSL